MQGTAAAAAAAASGQQLTHHGSANLSFPCLQFSQPSQIKPRWLVFAATLRDADGGGAPPALVYTHFRVPTVVMSHQTQQIDKVRRGAAWYGMRLLYVPACAQQNAAKISGPRSHECRDSCTRLQATAVLWGRTRALARTPSLSEDVGFGTAAGGGVSGGCSSSSAALGHHDRQLSQQSLASAAAAAVAAAAAGPSSLQPQPEGPPPPSRRQQLEPLQQRRPHEALQMQPSASVDFHRLRQYLCE